MKTEYQRAELFSMAENSEVMTGDGTGMETCLLMQLEKIQQKRKMGNPVSLTGLPYTRAMEKDRVTKGKENNKFRFFL
jgi:hypothetical protein